MFRRHFFGSRTTIGIDIQSQEIRFIQLEQSKEKLRILQAKVTPLPKKVIDNGYIEEEKTLKTILKNIAKETKTKGQSAIFAMPAHTLIIKKMSFARGLKKVEQMAEIADHLAIHFPQWAELTYDYVMHHHTTSEATLAIYKNL